MRIVAATLAALASALAERVQPAEFGKTPEGATVHIYTLINAHGLEAKITDYGGTVVSLMAPDRGGRKADVVLGFDSLAGYLQPQNPFFGAIIGRYANRIAQARFTLDGVEYKLIANNGANTLHGGPRGFDKQVWNARPLASGGLELRYLSQDGEQGFPGNLQVTVVYHLTDVNELRIEYAASSDKPTVVNLTSHSYFNMAGAGDILGHRIQINADRFTPVDARLIPTGELRSVAGTPFDLRKPTRIGGRIEQGDGQLKLAGGFDHNWVLNKSRPGLTLAARVEEPSSGRTLEVYTTEPGIQFYTANSLDGSLRGKSGVVYQRRAALCLETQHFPDSPNHSAFPSTVLRPGQRFQSTTIYKF